MEIATIATQPKLVVQHAVQLVHAGLWCRCTVLCTQCIVAIYRYLLCNIENDFFSYFLAIFLETRPGNSSQELLTLSN